MKCPHCQVDQPDPPPRFCSACGLATGLARKRTDEAAPRTMKCPECGVQVPLHAARCPGCGDRVRWPDGLGPDEGT